jgi:hypothetical protein
MTAHVPREDSVVAVTYRVKPSTDPDDTSTHGVEGRVLDADPKRGFVLDTGGIGTRISPSGVVYSPTPGDGFTIERGERVCIGVDAEWHETRLERSVTHISTSVSDSSA